MNDQVKKIFVVAQKLEEYEKLSNYEVAEKFHNLIQASKNNSSDPTDNTENFYLFQTILQRLLVTSNMSIHQLKQERDQNDTGK